MTNPVFERMRDSRGYATFGPPQGRSAGRSRTDVPGWSTPSASDLDHLYAQPSATTADTRRMTYDDVVVKTGIVFVALLAGAVVGWRVPGLMLIGVVGGLVLGLVNSFKRNPSPALIVGYGLLEGLALGGISGLFEAQYSGIVAQAVLATLSVFGVVLLGFRSGRLRTSPRLNKIFFIAIMGYLVFSVLNLVLISFAGQDSLRTGGLGLLIGAVAVLLASYSLVMDFEFIRGGVQQGVPARFAWTAAFGLTVTLVWLYLELLRILAILRSEN
jgi:uncharacterized YccA/Bax inhibitor family protein